MLLSLFSCSFISISICICKFSFSVHFTAFIFTFILAFLLMFSIFINRIAYALSFAMEKVLFSIIRRASSFKCIVHALCKRDCPTTSKPASFESARMRCPAMMAPIARCGPARNRASRRIVSRSTECLPGTALPALG